MIRQKKELLRQVHSLVGGRKAALPVERARPFARPRPAGQIAAAPRRATLDASGQAGRAKMTVYGKP